MTSTLYLWGGPKHGSVMEILNSSGGYVFPAFENMEARYYDFNARCISPTFSEYRYVRKTLACNRRNTYVRVEVLLWDKITPVDPNDVVRDILRWEGFLR